MLDVWAVSAALRLLWTERKGEKLSLKMKSCTAHACKSIREINV